MFEQVLPLAFAAVTAVTTWLAADRIRAHAARRVRDLEQCRDMLAVHTAALQTILASKDVSDDLKRRALDMSDEFENRDFVAAFVPQLVQTLGDNATPPLPSADASEFMANLDALPSQLQDAFAETVMTGLLAAMLRWPELTSQSATRLAMLASVRSQRLPWVIASSAVRRDDLQATPSHAVA